MHHDVIRRVVLFPLKFIRQHRHASIMFITHHTPRPVLAGHLPSLKIKRVPVRIVRRIPKRAHVPVFFQPTHLPVVRNVAEHQIFPLTIPCRPFRPQHSRIQTVDRRPSQLVFRESLVQHHDVRIRVPHRILLAPIPLRLLPICSRSRRNRRRHRSRPKRLLHKFSPVRHCTPLLPASSARDSNTPGPSQRPVSTSNDLSSRSIASRNRFPQIGKRSRSRF